MSGDREPFRRVSPNHPCPVCGPDHGLDWCGFTTYLVRCMRQDRIIVGGKVVNGKPSPKGGWTYLVRDLEGWEAPAVTEPAARGDVSALPETERSRWHQALVDVLGLSDAHRAALLGRGLPEAFVTQRQYRTLSESANRFDLVRRVMVRAGGTPIGVPGFYQYYNSKAPDPRPGSWTLAYISGLMIPILTADGAIRAFQIRRDTEAETWRLLSRAVQDDSAGSPGARTRVLAPDGRELDMVASGRDATVLLSLPPGATCYGGGRPLSFGLVEGQHLRNKPLRYLWLSSANKGLGGSSPGSPIHVSRPVMGGTDRSDVVWITEGPLKGDRLSAWKGDTALSVQGVSALNGILDELRPFRPRWVIVAFDQDQDPRVQAEVHRYRQVLLDQLIDAGTYRVGLASWSPSIKGIDDALQAGAPVRITRYRRKAA